MAVQTPPPFSAFLAIRYWPTWLAIFLLALIAWLPFTLRMKAGSLLGLLTFAFASERRYITRINIELCFPELDAKERRKLVRRCFVENGIGLIETATGWVRPPSHFSKLLTISGAHHMEAALAKGKGVLMLGAHYTTLDFSANLLSQHFPFAVTYRAHSNPLFDAFMLRGRLRNCNGVFDRKDIRGAFKHLRQSRILWYAPDQDYGPDQAVYAPFFGNLAATITAGSRFAAFNDSPVILVRHHRLAHKPVYVIEFTPVPEPFPGVDDIADATLVNQMLEAAIGVEPAQYLWMHKRFKTQAGGKPQSPYINIRTPNKKLSEAQYQQVVGAEAVMIDANPTAQKLLLKNGLQLWHFDGLARGLKKFFHPAARLDTRSKRLRSAGIDTVTVDNIFRIKARGITAVTCFVPAGTPLATSTHSVEPETMAVFFARLHAAGFLCKFFDNGNLLITGTGLALADPLALHRLPNHGAEYARCYELLQVCGLQRYTPEQEQVCCKVYVASTDHNSRGQLDTILAQLLAERRQHADNASGGNTHHAANDTGSSTTS